MLLRSVTASASPETLKFGACNALKASVTLCASSGLELPQYGLELPQYGLKERKGKERKGKEREGKERKGKGRKGKGRKGKGSKGK